MPKELHTYALKKGAKGKKMKQNEMYSVFTSIFKRLQRNDVLSFTVVKVIL